MPYFPSWVNNQSLCLVIKGRLVHQYIDRSRSIGWASTVQVLPSRETN